MDWERKSLEWSDEDFGKFCYAWREAIVVTKLQIGEGKAMVDNLVTARDWDIWFKRATFLQPKERKPGICVILCTRDAPVDFEGSSSAPSSAPVYYLPFDKHILKTIVERFHVHPTIMRTITREVPYFSIQRHGFSEWQECKITSTVRTASVQNDDLALSSAYLPTPGLTLAVVYGCNESQKQQLVRRISSVDLAYNHPTLLAGVLAELERVRLSRMVESVLDGFELQAWRETELDLDMDKAKMASSLKLSFESRAIVNQMQMLKPQLAKMRAETARFADSMPAKLEMKEGETLAKNRDGDGIPGKRLQPTFSQEQLRWESETLANNSDDDGIPTKQLQPAFSQEQLRRAGELIVSRLDEISTEFDDKINECKTIIDNMSLTMQTVWNHFAREDNKMNLSLARASTGFSKDMKRDSSQMRSIALLTMVFIPISTIASIFSADLFSWDPAEGKTVLSGYIWIFVVISLGLTTVTVGAWYLSMYRVVRKEDANRRRDDGGGGSMGV
ncbi:hypothetical protein QBC33DRAFT_551813 [Phialemonium atrogriseum]|uniref:Uncharacterized protein n=1 Tax=Phialemonium atrogriseum TaxID=1093897 RepID=A0AAJ0BT06_9PEZI|nr:uncharacterized protein QBC33DRAFT_551813 [Phialemonium atrogriseum]KAK1762559.1 hypothetical protein QBC33DRAFT_551813 [Phialemonium atrogriseum]